MNKRESPDFRSPEVGISAVDLPVTIRAERTQIHFLNDVVVAVASLDL